MQSNENRLAFVGDIFDLSGSTAFVTGAASGIGLAIATALARAGAAVTLGDVNEAQVVGAAETLQAEGLPASAAIVDVGDKEQVAAAFDLAERTNGPIDIVFANAGIAGGGGPLYGGHIEDVSGELWDAALRVNLNGAFFTMQEAARRMRGRGGRIVVTGSTAGERGDTMVGYPYTASKAAVTNLVRQAALDLAPDNVLVNAIVPGPFHTSIGAPAESPEKAAMELQFAASIPLNRVADADEIRGIALFLASGASSFVTGATFAIDGGSLAGRFEALD